jgi:hypothetical protein
MQLENKNKMKQRGWKWKLPVYWIILKYYMSGHHKNLPKTQEPTQNTSE